MKERDIPASAFHLDRLVVDHGLKQIRGHDGIADAAHITLPV
ncbi:hypothetical protein U5A82_17495 [Sphingobium sp. CR2-8]|nr:hypothetical protein [Sphingobium sp. CR2-8]MEC3912204.1 hypothetical protein [Sphingobium sp. CR2-8]